MIIGDGIMLGAGGESASIFVTGLSETDSVSATHKILKKVPNPASVVPDGYTQLEYIESAGTQYIDTGISVPHESLKVVVQFSTSNTTQDAPISGYAYSTWGWSTNMLYVNNNQQFGVNGVVGPTVVAGTVYEVEYSNTYFKINGATTSAAFTGYVDGYNNTVFYGNGKRGQYKLYFYKLYNGSLLVRDYVPAKRNSDGLVGLYDLVSNTFFGNSGTGTFVAGAEIPQYIDEYVDGKTIIGKWTQKPNPLAHGLPDEYTELEYLESSASGYPYINTGVPINVNSEISLEIQLTHTDGDQKLVGGFYPGLFIGTINGNWRIYTKSKYYTPFPATTDWTVITAKGTAWTFNGASYTCPEALGTSSYPIWLFQVNRQGSVESGTTQSVCRIKSFIHKISDALVNHMIPAKRNSDSAIGMYDLVSGTFFENSGTGTFTAGAEIPQYIDGFEIAPIKSYGTYTITASNGTATKTQDVLVDSANDFNIKITYNPNGALYWLGDECEAITGGWTNDYTFTTWSSSSYVRYQVTKEDEYMVSSAKAGYTLEGTANPIDLTNYSKVMWEIEELTITAGGGYYPGWRLCASPSRTFSTSTEICNEGASSTTPGKHTYTLDVSGLSGLYYISFTNNSVVYSGRSMTANILKIWLE